ncbi:hypothetical protein [Hymenobacter swuensis]|uniref:YcxB-like protein domain-containing protein n=1 Tax=Hymenobacter swuensis DY53 TaxID=1227739 RepID=W8EXS7_9BACT|nr:hypothetical protein [Hymenobacter swuensis]AHJ96562.1 hypothetical protein Hsw_0967 [Hymenobacter swuensis DY53]
MPSIQLPATPPTFPEYQLIHQTQERQRYPELAAKQKPATSDPWRRKVQLWLGLLAGAVGYCIWFEPTGGVGYLVIFSLFTGLGLLYQWWEYRRAFREYQQRPQPLGFRVSETGLAVQWPQGWQRLHWHSLTRVQQVGDWLLLYPGPDFAYYLDLRQVPEPYTAVDVLVLIGKHKESGPAATFAS